MFLQNKNKPFLFLKLCLLVSFLSPLEIFISNDKSSAEGNGTLLSPYATIATGIQENQANSTNLTIFLISSENPYIVDNISDITTNLIVTNSQEFAKYPFIEFRNRGSFAVNANFSLRFQNIRFISWENSQTIVFSIKNGLNLDFHVFLLIIFPLFLIKLIC